MEANIITECFVDTLLMETIDPPAKGYNHQKCCTKVLSTMENKLADEFALGIIDDDKVVPNDFLVFDLMKKQNAHLALYKHRNKPHYIIKIGKAAEDFILHTAKQCNISLIDYYLPTDLANLKKKTKHLTSKKDPDLKRLFVTLKQNNTSDFYKLAQWIDLIKTNPYSLPIDEL
jgi:hypothetical protein